MHFSHEGFKELMKIPENRKCFDCDSISCQWASINNGIFLCTNCSGIHRGLGVEKSYIRSILWDNWTDNQIEFMRKGGNKQLKELLNLYSFDIKSMSPEKFYNTKIMDFYRKYLKTKVEGNSFTESPPSKEEAFNESFINNNINNENKFSSFGSVHQDNNTDNNISFQDSIKDWMDKAYQGTKDSFSKLELGNKLTYAKNTIIDTGNKIIDNVQIKDIVKKTNETFSYYFNWIIGNNKNENIKNKDNSDINNQEQNEEIPQEIENNASK